jgi:DNA-binding XRE family transcriptional regulator
LRDSKEFAKAYLDGGTVCWPSGVDVAAEALYALAHELAKPKTLAQAKANELVVSLRDLRRKAGLTQQQVAKLLGVSQPELSQYEAGRADGRLSTLRKYVAAMGWELEVAAVQGNKRIPLRGV